MFEHELTLLPHKAIYIANYKLLIVSDILLGKAGQFRESEITMPGGLAESDLVTLDKIINELDVAEIIILGDLFRKGLNYDVRLFQAWREVHHGIDISLVKGSTDILADEIYSHFEIKLYKKYFLWNRFLFTHEPLDETVQLNGCDYIFSGQVQPGFKLDIKGKNSNRLPCYFFNEKQCILPAFGVLKSKFLVKPNGRDRVFVISKNNDYPVVLKVDKN